MAVGELACWGAVSDAMNVVVLYESMFGNTRVIAEAIAEGVREAVPDTQVACLRVAESDAERIQAADLLVVGGPTHIRGMTSGMTRKMGLTAEERKDEADRHETEPGAEGPGIRDWFDKLPKASPAARPQHSTPGETPSWPSGPDHRVSVDTVSAGGNSRPSIPEPGTKRHSSTAFRVTCSAVPRVTAR